MFEDVLDDVVDKVVKAVRAALKPQVTPRDSMISTHAESVQADIARAEYGLTGKSTKIQLRDKWIMIDYNPDVVCEVAGVV